MTSAVTVMAIGPAPPNNAGVLPNAATGPNAPAEMKSGFTPAEIKSGVSPAAVTPAAQASVEASASPRAAASKPAQIGVQVSSALLGLTVTDKSNSTIATAPDTPPPGTAAATSTLAAYTEFGVTAPASSQAADDEAGGSSGEQADTGEQESASPQTRASNAGALSTSAQGSTGTAGPGKKPAAAQHHIGHSPAPVIPQWHIRPKARGG